MTVIINPPGQAEISSGSFIQKALYVPLGKIYEFNARVTGSSHISQIELFNSSDSFIKIRIIKSAPNWILRSSVSWLGVILTNDFTTSTDLEQLNEIEIEWWNGVIFRLNDSQFNSFDLTPLRRAIPIIRHVSGGPIYLDTFTETIKPLTPKLTGVITTSC